MKLLRPYIPFSVRCLVASRQLGVDEPSSLAAVVKAKSTERLLDYLLQLLANKLGCFVHDLRLDHHPALENREKIIRGGKHVEYHPAANEKTCLIYRVKADHDIKTRVRGERGQFADNVIAKRERRRLKKLQGKRRKHKWPRGRKLQSRNNLRRRSKR